MLRGLLIMSVVLVACAADPGLEDVDRTTAYVVAVSDVCGGPCPESMAIAMGWFDPAVKSAMEGELGRTVTVGIPHNQQIDWLGISEARLSTSGRALIVPVEVVRASEVQIHDVVLVPENGSWRVATPDELGGE